MIAHESVIRFSIFLGCLVVMAVWEVMRPRRVLLQPKGRRWFANLALTAVDMLFVRFTLGAVAVSTAVYARDHGWGILHAINLPEVFSFFITIFFFDMAIYLQHVMSHALPVFWRLHRVHHTDLDFDVTTGLRFHPLEIFISMLYKAALAAALGAHPFGVLLFEVILNSSAQFNHGNVAIPLSLDRILRRFVVTPDMHRVHHSWKVKETNSNFGFFFPWWDRLFGTYRDQPQEGHREMTIGLKEYRDFERLNLLRLLWIPFEIKIGGYSFRRDD